MSDDMFRRVIRRARDLAQIRDPAVREHLQDIDQRLDELEARQDAMIRLIGFDVEAVQDRSSDELFDASQDAVGKP